MSLSSSCSVFLVAFALSCLSFDERVETDGYHRSSPSSHGVCTPPETLLSSLLLLSFLVNSLSLYSSFLRVSLVVHCLSLFPPSPRDSPRQTEINQGDRDRAREAGLLCLINSRESLCWILLLSSSLSPSLSASCVGLRVSGRHPRTRMMVLLSDACDADAVALFSSLFLPPFSLRQNPFTLLLSFALYLPWTQDFGPQPDPLLCPTRVPWQLEADVPRLERESDLQRGWTGVFQFVATQATVCIPDS